MTGTAFLDKEVENDTDLLSQRAEIFRSKLITDFHLLDTINEGGGRTEAPNFYTDDIIDPERMRWLIKKHPSSLVRFQAYSNKGEKQITMADRRRNRVKNKQSKNPPPDLWAHWLVESPTFQNLILALILINGCVLGVQGELNESEAVWSEKVKLGLEIFDYCTMFVYTLEIILKWIDSFWDFWKNRWNIFDFCVTFLFFVPEIINFSTGEWGKRSARSELTVIANNLRTFRILRSLKMVSRFQKVRLIVLAVTKAFQAMVFITVLLFIFSYIFAIIGVMFFKQGYKEASASLNYGDSFSNIVNALVTLFQLLTLDHWYEVYKDVTKVATPLFAAFYIILWIIIGSFIFRNIFVGIMVNNFQSIRDDLFNEVEEIKDRERRDMEMHEFAEELDRQIQARRASATSLGAEKQSSNAIGPDKAKLLPDALPSGHKSLVELKEAISQHVVKAEKDSTEWQKVVERNLENLSKEESYFCWPKDTLFRYLLVMEALQENLKERQEIMNLVNEALIQMHDT